MGARAAGSFVDMRDASRGSYAAFAAAASRSYPAATPSFDPPWHAATRCEHGRDEERETGDPRDPGTSAWRSAGRRHRQNGWIVDQSRPGSSVAGSDESRVPIESIGRIRVPSSPPS